jgi:hypothetical protein
MHGMEPTVVCAGCDAVLSCEPDLTVTATMALVEAHAHACPQSTWPAPIQPQAPPPITDRQVRVLWVAAYYRSPYENLSRRIGVMWDRCPRPSWRERIIRAVLVRIERADIGWLAGVADLPPEERPANRLRSVLDGD